MAFLRRTMLIPFVLAFSTAGCAKPVPVASLPSDTAQTPMGAENQPQMTSEATQTVQGPPEWFTNPASDAGVSAPDKSPALSLSIQDCCPLLNF